MDIKILVSVLGTLLVSTTAITVTDKPTESPFVPGVFIAADALKNLQDQAKPDASAITRTEARSEIPGPPSNDQAQGYDQMQEQPSQPIGNQQLYPNQQASYYPNQQTGYPMQNQPLVYGNQPVRYGNQPVSYGNQPASYGNQPLSNGNQPVIYGNQPGMYLIQPGYQQNPQNPQAFLVNNPTYQQPGFNQQPYQNPQGVIYNQQPPYQQPILVSQPTLGAQQPNQQLFIPNGQLGQPNMVENPNLAGQQTLINNPSNGALYTSPVQSPGNLYAMVPVSSQNNMANPNLGNNNGYFVPVQQMPANTRDTARK